jgi:hypothetical protein
VGNHCRSIKLKSCGSLVALTIGLYAVAGSGTTAIPAPESSEGIVAKVQRLESVLLAQAEEIEELQKSVAMAHVRLDTMKLAVRNAKEGPSFMCGEQHKEADDNLIFMYGSRDGTGCNVRNVNFYKELVLTVPIRELPAVSPKKSARATQR